jgi:hypothetical protein
MSDVATQLRASVEAQARAQDLLAAAEDILAHGNALFNNVRDFDAFKKATLANIRATQALIAFYEIVLEAYDEA